jgi:RNA polymerase sigma factor (sigma-70 family)
MELAVATHCTPKKSSTPRTYEDNRERDKKLMELVANRRTAQDQIRSDAAWELLWEGDPEDERQLITRNGGKVNKGYKRLVYSEAARKLGSGWDDVEDCVTTVKLSLREEILKKNIDFRLSLIPLIVTYVKNYSINFRNRLSKRKTDNVGDLMTNGKADPVALAYYNHADAAPSPRDIAQNNELATQIAAVFDALPEKDRDILIMQHLEGMSYKQISEALRIPMGTVMSRLSNARNKFSSIWQTIQADEPSLNMSQTSPI